MSLPFTQQPQQFFNNQTTAESKSDLLSFLDEESIWSVVHVILSYHTYLYSRHWRSVVMCYYVFISVQLYLFSLLGWGYSKYFSELSEQSSEIQFERACFSVTCNTLFIGGSIQTLLGVLMGVIHAELFSPCKYDKQYFHPVSFFKDYALKKDKVYNNLINSIERKRHYSSSLDKNNKITTTTTSPSRDQKAKKVPLSSSRGNNNINPNLINILSNGEFVQSLEIDYGLWPWRLWFGLTPNCNTKKKGWYLDGDMTSEKNPTTDDNGDGDDNQQQQQQQLAIKKMIYLKWEFRRRYWKRWFQLTLLGMPATIFLTLDGEGPLKAGLLLYGLITTSLLVIFKKSNEYDYINDLLSKCDEEKIDYYYYYYYYYDVGEDTQQTQYERKKKLVNTNLNVMLNNYDKLYTTWIFSTVFIIGFHNIPFLTSFYRVLLAVLIVVCGSLMLKFITFLIEKHCVTK